jgi:hypothetical protein
MKNLVLAAVMLICISAKAQTKTITNNDGTQSTITRTGDNLFIIDGKGKHITITNTGNHSVLMDGSNYITFSRSGGTTTMATSDGGMYNWIDVPNALRLVGKNGNYSPYERNATPFTLSVAGRKFWVTIYVDAFTLEHLDGSNLVTTIIGDKVITDYPEVKPPAVQRITGIRSKIVNADGTYTTVIKDGDTYKVKTEYTLTRQLKLAHYA